MLHRVLEQAGIENIVVNPGSIEVAIHNRVKTDKRDALKIATLLEAGRLKGIRVPSIQQEQERLLTRTREQLVEERSAIKNKIPMKCHQMGLIDPNDIREMSHKLVEEMLAQSPSQEFSLVIEAYWSVWKSIETQIRKLEQQLKEQAKTDPNDTIYRSAPGIGPLSARILSHELGDLSQFALLATIVQLHGTDSLARFPVATQCGRGISLVPGNTRVRHILNQAAWRAIKIDRDLKAFFERLSLRTGKKRAIVAVARKLIGRIRAAFKTGQPYQMNPISPQVA